MPRQRTLEEQIDHMMKEDESNRYEVVELTEFEELTFWVLDRRPEYGDEPRYVSGLDFPTRTEAEKYVSDLNAGRMKRPG